MQGALTEAEAGSLKTLEAVIESGLQTIGEMGHAIRTIRDSKLYRETHGTFADYCQERFGRKRRWAYQLITAAEVAENVRNCAQNEIANEAHARELARLPAEVQGEVWQELHDMGVQITAETVRSAVDDWLTDQVEDREPDATGLASEAATAPLTPDVEVLPPSSEAEEELPPPATVVDRAGNATPEELQHLFETAPKEFKSRVAELNAVLKWASSICDDDAGAALESQMMQFRSDIGNAANVLRATTPHAVCPYCKCELPKVANCQACSGRGWVCRDIYNAAPKELRGA